MVVASGAFNCRPREGKGRGSLEVKLTFSVIVSRFSLPPPPLIFAPVTLARVFVTGYTAAMVEM